MPRVTFLQTNFSAGELSPRLYGRVDIAKYANGAKRLRNALVLKHGGARRRYGSLFVRAAKNPTQRARLIPFVFSRDDAYVLELGAGYMRVFKNGGQVETSPGVPYELATPFTEAQVRELDYSQGADTMFLYHGDVPTQRLVRLGDTRWELTPAVWLQQPTDEIGQRFPGVSMTLSAASVGAGRTATASGGDVFLASDIGRTLAYDGGRGTIVGVTSATVATVDITQAFTGTALPAGGWVLEGTPNIAAKPFEKDQEPTEGKNITIGGGNITGTEPTKPNGGASWSGGTVTMTCNVHGYATGEWILVDSVAPDGYNGVQQITVVDANTYTYALAANPGLTGSGGTSAKLTGSITPTWRPTDAGSLIRINGGAARILTVQNPISVRVRVLQSMSGESLAPAGAWTLETGVWSAALGYPRTGTFYEQRHIVAGTRTYPTTVWGSVIKEPLNFELGTGDDKGFSFAIASDQINPIAFVSPGRTLVVLTYGGEFTMNGGIEKPIAPTNVQVRPRSTHGCELVRPIRIGSEHLFVERSGREVRAFAYNVTNDDFSAPDVSVLAEHLTESGIVDLAYQKKPDTVLWCVRADGKLAACTYDRDANVDVIAWQPHDTDGAFESVAVIPAGDTEQAWALVRRTVNGNTVRFVERIDPDALLDCAVAGTSGPGATAWTGLSHLEGKTVDVVADGAYAGRFTVTAGAITLPRPATAVLIGLPYSTEIELLDPELQTGMGSAFGNSMRSGEITVRLLGSVGGLINGQRIPTRQVGPDQLDAPPISRTGLFRIENLGWARGESPVVIEQPLPLPFHVLAVARKLTVND